jgi:hypothetical protein
LETTALNYPHGINLLANTSELAIGVVLAPITWLFGPVATLNVALTLAPALSALAMFVLLLRWVSWAPAAFFGGLFYGFSPFILVSLTNAHLMLAMAVVPPLLVLCLDELLFRQRWNPIVTGLAIALLLTLQFFIGTEMLLIIVVSMVISILLIVVYGVLHNRNAVRSHSQYALNAGAVAAVTTVVLLAFPTEFALHGPAHYVGAIWPGVLGVIYRSAGTTLKGFMVTPSAYASDLLMPSRELGGYQGPVLSQQYFGLGVAATLLIGFLVLRRDRRLWFFGLLALVSAALSLSVTRTSWSPWSDLSHLPLLQNIQPGRFVLVAYLAVAAMLALIVDRTWKMVRNTSGRRSAIVSACGPALCATLVAGVAIAPIASYFSQGIPLTSQPVVVPAWFSTIAPHLRSKQVLLVLPAPFSSKTSAIAWQAIDSNDYSLVGVGGPSGVISRAGKERDGQVVLTAVSVDPEQAGFVDRNHVVAVREALRGWGVTVVVIPDQSRLPLYERMPSVTSAKALMTAAIGMRPLRQTGAWVWVDVKNHLSQTSETGQVS